MNNEGQSCSDGDFGTIKDKYVNGECKGIPVAKENPDIVTNSNEESGKDLLFFYCYVFRDIYVFYFYGIISLKFFN